MSTLQVKVSDIASVTETVKQFTLVAANDEPLPPFSGGSHIVVAMNINGRTHRNAYSLMSSTGNTESYQIGVRKQDQSRGGSVYMHEQVKVGDVLEVTYPVNLFAINKMARKHVLVAGGIGITPFLSQISDLNRLGYDYELHYAYRSEEHAAFKDYIEDLCGDKARFYIESEGARIDMSELLSQKLLGTHVYICGPEPMVNALHLTADSLGWPSNHIHSEQFSAPPMGDPFSVSLSESGITLEVPGELSLLEALEAAGVDAPFLCRGGACGRCEIEVEACDGVLQHYDHYLSDAEKMAGDKVMTCVSRAKCNQLVLKL